MRSILTLCLVLALVAPSAAEKPGPETGIPFCGLAALDPFADGDRAAARLERLADLGAAFVRTAPIAWGRIEPQPPRAGPPRYRWKALDEAVLIWQLTGLRPVLALSPSSTWGSVPASATAWVRRVNETLPPAEARGALRGAGGSGPPRPGRWRAWERFVRDVVERYDGDGRDDMPGLRRPVRHIQVLTRLEPAQWLGGVEDYMRVLHHTGVGAKSAHEQTRLVTAAVDLQATGHAPFPDRREWDYRIGKLAPTGAKLVRLGIERRFAHIRRLLEMSRLYDVVAHLGSDHVADDVANLRFLRRHLDEHGGGDTSIWLVDNPTRKLGRARAIGAVEPRAPEARLRRRWLPAARNPAHSRHRDALAWLRRGQAFDLVRGIARARAAGADVVFSLAPFDELPEAYPGRRAAGDQGLLAKSPAGGLRRTPSWWALQQMQQLLRTHRSAGEASIGAPGRSVVFRLEGKGERPWIALVMLDPRLSWAGTPGAALPVRDVLVPLPSGTYIVESLRLGPEAPKRRRVVAKEGMVSLALTPAPVYVIPVD